MADLLQILPNFDTSKYRHLMHSLERDNVTVADLVSIEPAEIARRCPLPLLDVQKLVADVVLCLHKGLGMLPVSKSTSSDILGSTSSDDKAKIPKPSAPLFISTLDPELDKALGGGFPTRYVSEIVGESAIGKTQLLYELLLSVQQHPPKGLGKAALYLSTEDALYTNRLVQILEANSVLSALTDDTAPSLDHIHTKEIKDLDLLQNVVEFQLPRFVEQKNIGLIVLDSVTAHLRDTDSRSGLSDRAAELARLGTSLRRLATEKNVAVVLSNQVSDRFAEALTQDVFHSSASSSVESQSAQRAQRTAVMSLDHQQRFFTGWGDDDQDNVKTPALGLAWTSQIDARVVCKFGKDEKPGSMRRRLLNIVFAPWTNKKTFAIEYSIGLGGLAGTPQEGRGQELEALLDEDIWKDEDFP